MKISWETRNRDEKIGKIARKSFIWYAKKKLNNKYKSSSHLITFSLIWKKKIYLLK